MNGVAVIVPVYNMGRYLDRCVESVLRQSWKDFTLVLLDDGSTDDSLERCLKWKQRDKRIIVISKANEGLGPTRNFGVRMVDAEYITFLDSDDWWHPDYLRLMMQGTENGKNDIVLCDMNYVHEVSPSDYETHVSRLRFKPGKLDLSVEWNLMNRARTFMCGKLFRRHLFIRHHIEQPHHTYEDVATTPYLVVRADSIYYVPKGLYYYLRNRPGSIVNHFQSLRGLSSSLLELYERFRGSGLVDKFYLSLRQLFWGQLVFIHRSLGSRFSSEGLEERERIKNEALRVVYGCFPELQKISRLTFGVTERKNIIIKALRNIVLDEKSIWQNVQADRADIIVSSKQNAYMGKSILVSIPAEFSQDEESVEWDIADEIFREIWTQI